MAVDWASNSHGLTKRASRPQTAETSVIVLLFCNHPDFLTAVLVCRSAYRQKHPHSHNILDHLVEGSLGCTKTFQLESSIHSEMKSLSLQVETTKLSLVSNHVFEYLVGFLPAPIGL